jgi:hypothetical protein
MTDQGSHDLRLSESGKTKVKAKTSQDMPMMCFIRFDRVHFHKSIDRAKCSFRISAPREPTSTAARASSRASTFPHELPWRQ